MDTLTSFYIGLPFMLTVVYGDICNIDGRDSYCSYGCCDIGDSQMCCLSPYQIAGIVFGGISIICAIAALIFCLCKKKQQGRVVNVMNQPQPNVWVVNSSNNTSSHSQPYNQPYHQHYGHQSKNSSFPPTQPLPPGYASTYNNTYPSGQPPFGSTEPPPAYSYNNPSSSSNSNPFATAAYGRK